MLNPQSWVDGEHAEALGLDPGLGWETVGASVMTHIMAPYC